MLQNLGSNFLIAAQDCTLKVCLEQPELRDSGDKATGGAPCNNLNSVQKVTQSIAYSRTFLESETGAGSLSSIPQ